MPLHRNQPALYEVDLSLRPPSCLPTGIDMSKLRDVTPVGALWRKYFDVETGKIHDGAEYARKMEP